jgi:hypothetical protein
LCVFRAPLQPAQRVISALQNQFAGSESKNNKAKQFVFVLNTIINYNFTNHFKTIEMADLKQFRNN